MEIRQGNFYWNRKDNIKYSYEYLKEDKICDVLIIGGGIGGAITAYFQAKQGYKVILVEKNLIGYGSTLENPGILSYLESVDLNKKGSKNLSENNLKRSDELSKQAIENIHRIVKEINEFNKDKEEKILLNRQDLLYFSDKLTNKMQVYKEYTNLKDRQEVEYIEENGVLNMKTGVLVKHAAVTFNPYLFVQELIHMLSKMSNVEIYENTEIDNITNNDEYVQSLCKNRQIIYSKKVILCTGYSVLKNVKELPVSLMKSFSVVTEPIKNVNLEGIDFVAKDITNPSNYIRFTKNKEIIVGGNTLKVTEKVLTERNMTQLIDGRYKKIFNSLIRLFPNEEKIRVKSCYWGMYLETKDGLPIIDELEDLPNVYVNIGSGLNGVVHSAIGANMLRDICKEYHTKDMIMYKINR